VRETRRLACRKGASSPPLLSLEHDVTFLHQNTTTGTMYHSSIESIEAAEDPQKGGGNIFGISAHIIRGMLRCFACNHPQLLDSHLLLVRLQRPFAPAFQRIEARRSLKNSDDLHRLQRFRASIFAPLPRERLFGNVAGEGGEGQESGSKLGENVSFSYCGARVELQTRLPMIAKTAVAARDAKQQENSSLAALVWPNSTSIPPLCHEKAISMSKRLSGDSVGSQGRPEAFRMPP
jgi:hypothetical protein